MRPDISLWTYIKGEFIGQWYSAALLSPWWQMDEKRKCRICGKIERPTEESLIALYDDGIVYECHHHGTPNRMTVVDCFTNQEIVLLPDRGIFIQGLWNVIDDGRYWLSSTWRFVVGAPRYWALFWLRALSYYSRKLANRLDRDYQ